MADDGNVAMTNNEDAVWLAAGELVATAKGLKKTMLMNNKTVCCMVSYACECNYAVVEIYGPERGQMGW